MTETPGQYSSETNIGASLTENTRFEEIDRRFDDIDHKFEEIDHKIDDRFNELDRKLDAAITDRKQLDEKFDTYRQANQQLVQLAFTLIASATITVIVTAVLKR